MNMRCGLLIALLVLITSMPAWAQVAHDGSSESHSGSTGSTSEASVGWTHTPSGTLRGITVFTCDATSSTHAGTAVTYGGVSLTAVSGGEADDTAGGPGSVKAWHLGASIPTGAQTVTVTRTNNANVMYAVAAGQTASSDTATHDAGVVLLQEDGNFAEQSVTDGSPGTNSWRYAAGFSGIGSTALVVAGANSTLVQLIDFAVGGCFFARENAAGQGARSIGFSYSSSTDDRAGVHVAVKEISAAGGVAPSNCGALMLLGVEGC